jgi:Ser/Thr protein kinase RdoA (MazF antagonist)
MTTPLPFGKFGRWSTAMSMAESQLDADEFLLRIGRYRKRVLEPAGLNFTDGRRHQGSHFPNHGVFSADHRIWKFYSPPRARNARNTVKMASLLRSEGIPTPSILHRAVGYRTVKEHGLACIIMERIEGNHYDPDCLTKPGASLAPVLARLHRITSASWGDLTWQPGGSSLERFIGNTGARCRNRIQKLVERIQHSPLEGLEPWFERHRPLMSLDGGPFQLVHGDLHESNILQSPDGIPHLIDLDFSGYRSFVLDLADIVQRANAMFLPIADPDSALEQWEGRARPFLEDYFRLAPETFRPLWRSLRPVSFVMINLRAYLEGLQMATPRACERRGIDHETLLRELHGRRRLIDALLES